MKHALIIGCGYVGTALARQLLADGWKVSGVVASKSSAQELVSYGIHARIADCRTEQGARTACAEPADLVVYAVSSGGGDYRSNYLEGMRWVLKALEKHPPRGMIYTGSASVYAQTGGEWVTEESPANPANENGMILRETESLLLETVRNRFPSTVLRLSGIYGHGRHHLLDELRLKKKALSIQPDGIINRIFREDIVRAIQVIFTHLERGSAPEILNVTDDEPSINREVVQWLCQRLGREVPSFDIASSAEMTKRGSLSRNACRRISNARMKSLGWKPSCPSYREGFEGILSL